MPFFPQADFQCGPAALATVLAYSGASVTPEELTTRIYLPGRRGSLQVELIAATRQYDRVAYPLDPTLGALRAEVAAGRPVLVLQNLGLRSLPRWHYAVVVGASGERFVLRSGAKRRHEMSERRFLATWDRAGRWALVILEPGALPETPDRERLTAAAAALEAVGRLESARATYRAILGRWPEDSTAWLGLGNSAYRLGALPAAEAAYRRALSIAPADAATLNNLAQVMADRGCVSEARSMLDAARRARPPEHMLTAIADTERALASADAAPASCDPVAPAARAE